MRWGFQNRNFVRIRGHREINAYEGRLIFELSTREHSVSVALATSSLRRRIQIKLRRAMHSVFTRHVQQIWRTLLNPSMPGGRVRDFVQHRQPTSHTAAAGTGSACVLIRRTLRMESTAWIIYLRHAPGLTELKEIAENASFTSIAYVQWLVLYLLCSSFQIPSSVFKRFSTDINYIIQ